MSTPRTPEEAEERIRYLTSELDGADFRLAQELAAKQKEIDGLKTKLGKAEIEREKLGQGIMRVDAELSAMKLWAGLK